MSKKTLKFILFSLSLIFFGENKGFSSALSLPEGLSFEKDNFVYTGGKRKEDFSLEIQKRIQAHEILKKLEAQAVGDDKALTSQENPHSLPSYETFFETSEDPLYTALKNAQIAHFILETSAEIQKDFMIPSHRTAALDHLTQADEVLNPVFRDSTCTTNTLDTLFQGIASKTPLQRSALNPERIKFGVYCEKDEIPPSIPGCTYILQASRFQTTLRYEYSYPIDELIIFGISPNGKCAHSTAGNKSYFETVDQLMQPNKREARAYARWPVDRTIVNLERKIEEEIKRQVEIEINNIKERLKINEIRRMESQLEEEIKEQVGIGIKNINGHLKKRKDITLLLRQKTELVKLRRFFSEGEIIEEGKKEIHTFLMNFFSKEWAYNTDIQDACLARERVYVNWIKETNQWCHGPLEAREVTALFKKPEKPYLLHGFHYRPGGRGLHFTALVEKGNWQQMILRKLHEYEHQLFRKNPRKERDPQTGKDYFIDPLPEEAQEKYDTYCERWGVN